MNVRSFLFFVNLYGLTLVLGFFLGVMLVQVAGFYVESWGFGSDYFFFDWVNWDFNLFGGL